LSRAAAAIMHAVVRTYSGKGAKELFDILENNKPEVERPARLRALRLARDAANKNAPPANKKGAA
jgi:hypothetical protein